MQQVTVYGLGSSVTLELTGERAGELKAAIEQVWARCLRPLTAGVPQHPATLSFDWPSSLDGSEPPDEPTQEALDALLVDVTQRVTRKLIDARMGELVMLHAGGVANPDTGAAAIFVAPGGTGKTTLTKLMGRDFAYLTDETIGLDPRTGIVLPYPKPLSVRIPSQSGIKNEISPDALGLRPTPTRSVRAKHLFVLTRKAEATEPLRIDRLSASDFILAVAPESSSLSKLPEPLQLLLSLWRGADTVARITYQEAENVAAVVSQLLNGGDPQIALNRYVATELSEPATGVRHD